MKVLNTKIFNNEIWISVELDRNTDILAKKLFTEEEVEILVKEASQKAVKNFLDGLYSSWIVEINTVEKDNAK